MTPSQIDGAIEKLCAAYSHVRNAQNPAPVRELWRDHFADIPVEAMRTVIHDWIQTSKFWPTVADIRDQLPPQVANTAKSLDKLSPEQLVARIGGHVSPFTGDHHPAICGDDPSRCGACQTDQAAQADATASKMSCSLQQGLAIAEAAIEKGREQLRADIRAKRPNDADEVIARQEAWRIGSSPATPGIGTHDFPTRTSSDGRRSVDAGRAAS
ncbi:MAG: hypothetical protein AAGF73_09000 [Actinomycetota bacterium]